MQNKPNLPRSEKIYQYSEMNQPNCIDSIMPIKKSKCESTSIVFPQMHSQETIWHNEDTPESI